MPEVARYAGGVNSGHDADALRWEGDDDPAPSRPLTRPSVTPREPAAAAEGTEAGADADDAVTVVDGPAPLGNVALVSLGLLAGVYLLYCVGWLLGGGVLRTAASFLVADAAFLPAYVVAVAAPAVWFALTLVLTRRSAPWLRFVWLGAGVVLLVPWPFVMFGLVS